MNTGHPPYNMAQYGGWVTSIRFNLEIGALIKKITTFKSCSLQSGLCTSD